MSAQQHTHGRLNYAYHRRDVSSNGTRYCSIFTEFGSADAMTTHITNYVLAPDARRLVTCWNFCENVSTNDVEMMTKGGGLVEVLAISARGAMADDAEILSLKKQLASARALLSDALEAFDDNPAEDHEVADRIRAFLKGQP